MKFDTNERAFLKALYVADPERQNWTWPMMVASEAQGGDAIGNTPSGKFSVAKRLKQRGLIESDGAMRSEMTGVSLTEKGQGEAAKL